MKSRRRPLSIYNANADSKNQSVSDHSSCKRQCKVSHQASSKHKENNNDIENTSSTRISDESNNDHHRSIQIRSIISTTKKNNNESKEEEITDSDEEPIMKPHITTRDEQINTKTIFIIRSSVDHTDDTLSENEENQILSRLRPRRINSNEARFFLHLTSIDGDDTSQSATFSSIQQKEVSCYTTPQRSDDADIDYEELVNRTRIKLASLDQRNQGQLFPDENIDNGYDTEPMELISYLLQLEQSLMPFVSIEKQNKSKDMVIYQRRFQFSLDYLYGHQRREQISELIRLHLHSRLVLNTLFLTVNLFDRAILTGQIPCESYSNGNRQLLLTCLLIAGKVEEVEWPSISSLIANRESLSARDIKSLEIIVLHALSFDIGLTVLDFVYRYCEISPMDKSSDDLDLLFFILQLLLIDPQTFVAHKSSYIAACSYTFVRNVKQYEITWPHRLAQSTGYDSNEIAYGVTRIAVYCLRALSSNEHRDLMHKYAKGPVVQLIQYEQVLIDLIRSSSNGKK